MNNQEKVRVHEFFCYLKEVLTSRNTAVHVCGRIRDEENIFESLNILQRWTLLAIRLKEVDDGEFFNERLNLKKEVDFLLREMAFFGISTPEKPVSPNLS